MNAAEWVQRNWAGVETRLPTGKAPVLGIAGSQGSGKSWLARYIAAMHPGAVLVLSLDDFYHTRKQRATLANHIHPNLRTRGVPGTHDIGLLEAALKMAQQGRKNQGLLWPRFDKLQDDRLPETQWNMAAPPFDLIILEGWCIGARPQKPKALQDPINDYEAETDGDAVWRTFVNQKLAGDYRTLFAQLDMILFLKAPDFSTVFQWRLQQEAETYQAKGLEMPADRAGAIQSFIQGYQRITHHMITNSSAQINLALDEARHVVKAPSWSAA